MVDTYYADAPGVPREKLVKLTDYEALQSRLHQLSEDHSHCEDVKHELGERVSRAESRLEECHKIFDELSRCFTQYSDVGDIYLAASPIIVRASRLPRVVERREPVESDAVIAPCARVGCCLNSGHSGLHRSTSWLQFE